MNFLAKAILPILALILVATSASALTRLARSAVSPEQRISNEEFFQSVDAVDSTLGIGIQGLVREFVDAENSAQITLDFSKASISDRNGVACIQIEENCWSLGVSLENAVRIAHWVAQGTWRAFSCTRVDKTADSRRIQKILTADGLIDVGRELQFGCGNNFIHTSLNSTELIEMMRLIDFNWGSFDQSTCSLRRAAELNVEYGITTVDPRSSASSEYRQSWVNIDFDERYVIGVSPSEQQFYVVEGQPQRYRWRRTEGQLPHIFAVCESFPISLVDSDSEQISVRALRAFAVAAIFRTWSSQQYGPLVDAVNVHVDNYD
ncbi:hypothetical protein [Tateyamaria omphalii]|uniref:hypothetical protein n=1 Tax=Tateyamaria omphalii TaxID=299262 RepID=UPI001678FBA0|nr:hypothetical protein [Tateyamaria omphalii]